MALTTKAHGCFYVKTIHPIKTALMHHRVTHGLTLDLRPPDRLSATQGLTKLLVALHGLSLLVPDHTHISRRVAQLSVVEPRIPRKGQTHVEADSTEKDIIGVEIATTDWGDNEILPGVLDQIPAPFTQVSTESAYDTGGCHKTVAQRQTHATTTPPREGAVRWGEAHPRDAILYAIDAKGFDNWKTDSGYHRPTLAENAMNRLSGVGERLLSRTFERQVTKAYAGMATQASPPSALWRYRSQASWASERSISMQPNPLVFQKSPNPHFSHDRVARAPGCRCGAPYGPSTTESVADTTSKLREGVQRATASASVVAAVTV